MVNIHVRAEAEAVDQWIHALAIPLQDIDRLSLRPLKWLRYVTFTVVGARGNLFDAPDGNLVDYENVSIANIAENANYYFVPDGNAPHFQPFSTHSLLTRCYETGNCHFADPQGLNDRVTSSSLTERRNNFRRDVALRDGNRCVVTATEFIECQAAHIIPLRKGNEVLFRMLL